MKFFYNLGISVYWLGARVSALFKEKPRQFVNGRKKLWQFLEANLDKEASYVWFHAASLGEFEQGRPVMEALKKECPDKKILVTFFSPSGYEVRKNYQGADLICYLPMDTPGNAQRFLNLVKPEKAVFIKYEFWFHYINELQKREIPTFIISAIFRPNQVFFKSYGPWFRKMLHQFSHIFVQDEASKALLNQYGVTHLSVAGDTRFDRVYSIVKEAKELPLIEHFKDKKPVLVCGSSWPKDENLLIQYLKDRPNIKVIFAPHEVHEAHIEAIEKSLQVPSVRYTEATMENVKNARVLIINTIGLLSSIYRYGEVAYIGGGFGVGIHNTLEAATYGVPVVFGPNYQKFKEARDLIANKGAQSISTYEELEEVMDRYFNNGTALEKAGEASGNYVKENIGATDQILSFLR